MTASKAITATSSGSEELVYAPALLILSQDLYPRKLEIIREYIQNASDAIDAFYPIADQIDDPTEPLIKLQVQQRSLIIFDTGIGMDAENVNSLRRVAYSEKKVGKEAGYKGIGRLAGIAVADKLKISTTSYGDNRLHHFEFLAREMREDVSEKKRKGVLEPASRVIERFTRFWDDEADPKEHYTMVEIRGISENCPELLDERQIKEYVGEVAPVDFSPEFTWGAKISHKLRQNVPDYSPKVIYFSSGSGERTRIYKPFKDEMAIAEPEFQEITDPQKPSEVMGYCWYASKGTEVLGKIRPSGKIFSVEASDKDQRQRFAGLAYKLFGFTIGDRTLPSRTLWPKSSPRSLWFTGEIHIVNKEVQPTTDRSDFIESEARKALYQGGRLLAERLNKEAQIISDDWKTFDDSIKIKESFRDIKSKLHNNKIERSVLGSIEEDIYDGIEKTKKRINRCSDKDVKDFANEILKLGRNLSKELEDAKTKRGDNEIQDLASELKMTDKARKVYQIIMSILEKHYGDRREDYYEISSKIHKALKKSY